MAAAAAACAVRAGPLEAHSPRSLRVFCRLCSSARSAARGGCASLTCGGVRAWQRACSAAYRVFLRPCMPLGPAGYGCDGSRQLPGNSPATPRRAGTMTKTARAHQAAEVAGFVRHGDEVRRGRLQGEGSGTSEAAIMAAAARTRTPAGAPTAFSCCRTATGAGQRPIEAGFGARARGAPTLYTARRRCAGRALAVNLAHLGMRRAAEGCHGCRRSGEGEGAQEGGTGGTGISLGRPTQLQSDRGAWRRRGLSGGGAAAAPVGRHIADIPSLLLQVAAPTPLRSDT